MEIVIHTLVSAGVLYAASKMIDGVEVDGAVPALISAVVVGLVNGLIWFVFGAILAPLIFLTIGLIALVVNAVALKFTASVVRGFHIRSFRAALMAAVAIALMNLLLGLLIGR